MKKNLLIALLAFAMNAKAQTVALYSFSQSMGTYTAIAGTSILAAGIDDAVSTFKNIGFTFNYGGINYTQFLAGSNGYIVIGTGMMTTTPFSYPNTISFFGRDGETNSIGGAVTDTLTGSSPNQVLTIQFPNWEVRYSLTANLLSAQIKLYQTTNVVQIIYGTSVTSGTVYKGQVGLIGNTISDYNTRGDTTTAWNATIAGTTASDLEFSSLNYPANGETYTWTPPTVSINEKNNNDNIINFFPNPATDKLTIETGDLQSTNFDLCIYDIVGNLVSEKILYNKVSTIDISALSKGMYFIKIKTDRGVESRKFVKL